MSEADRPQQKPERVIVAMSGGVDSSVAAARLMAQGYDVVGVTLHLWDYPDDGSVKGRCCAPEDVHDARRVADVLGFPHYAFDRRELFESEVVAPFVESYLAGETPSPCVRCNRGVKIRELVRLADRLGASRVATGHYVRIEEHEGRMELFRAKDLGKDQSYFLHMLPDSTLRRLMFPLGDLGKPEVRAEALRLGLPGAKKGESQELCFVPTGRYDELVEFRAKDRVRPGPIVGPDGKVVGEHAGVHRFTVGQRRNLGVAVGARAYVVDIDVPSGTVRLGEREELACAEAWVGELSLRDRVKLPFLSDVSVRYRGKTVRAEVVAADPAPQPSETPTSARVLFREPVHAVVPGQFAVFYDGERVLGGGVIQRTLNARATDSSGSVASPEDASPSALGAGSAE
jgi:tRNA-specific 2-thiouridylase